MLEAFLSANAKKPAESGVYDRVESVAQKYQVRMTAGAGNHGRGHGSRLHANAGVLGASGDRVRLSCSRSLIVAARGRVSSVGATAAALQATLLGFRIF